MQLNARQEEILHIVKDKSPITGEDIAAKLKTTRASLRGDLTFLTQLGFLEARPRVGYAYRQSTPEHALYKDLMNLQVKDYQSQPAVLKSTATAYDALVALFVHNIGSVFVVDEKKSLDGVISRKDLLKVAMGQNDMHKVPIGMVMTRMPNVIMTTENESIWDAARKLITHEIDALPVVRQDEEEQWYVVGRFTKTNVTRAFVELGYGKLL